MPKKPISKTKASTINFNNFSRRYFNLAGEEIMYIEITNLLCKWIMVDEVLFDDMFKTLDFDALSKFEIQSKLVNFEMKLLSMNKKENDVFIAFVKDVSIEIEGKGFDVVKDNAHEIDNQKNVVTYAQGTLQTQVVFENDSIIQTTYSIVSGPFGNGAVPNGTWKIVQHPKMGFNRNSYFVIENDTYPVFQINAMEVEHWNDESTFKNRSNILLHPTEENNISFVSTTDKKTKSLAQTEGGIGVLHAKDCKNFFPFIAMYLSRNAGITTVVDFTNNQQVCKDIYKNV